MVREDALSLEKSPFLFTRPIMSSDEKNLDSVPDKHLGLWRVQDLTSPRAIQASVFLDCFVNRDKAIPGTKA